MARKSKRLLRKSRIRNTRSKRKLTKRRIRPRKKIKTRKRRRKKRKLVGGAGGPAGVVGAAAPVAVLPPDYFRDVHGAVGPPLGGLGRIVPQIVDPGANRVGPGAANRMGLRRFGPLSPEQELLYAMSVPYPADADKGL